MHNMYVVVVFLSFVIGITSVYYLGNDNPVEEIAEEIIEKETGLEIDLSPDKISSFKIKP